LRRSQRRQICCGRQTGRQPRPKLERLGGQKKCLVLFFFHMFLFISVQKDVQ